MPRNICKPGSSCVEAYQGGNCLLPAGLLRTTAAAIALALTASQVLALNTEGAGAGCTRAGDDCPILWGKYFDEYMQSHVVFSNKYASMTDANGECFSSAECASSYLVEHYGLSDNSTEADLLRVCSSEFLAFDDDAYDKKCRLAKSGSHARSLRVANKYRLRIREFSTGSPDEAVVLHFHNVLKETGKYSVGRSNGDAHFLTCSGGLKSSDTCGGGRVRSALDRPIIANVRGDDATLWYVEDTDRTDKPFVHIHDLHSRMKVRGKLKSTPEPIQYQCEKVGDYYKPKEGAEWCGMSLWLEEYNTLPDNVEKLCEGPNFTLCASYLRCDDRDIEHWEPYCFCGIKNLGPYRGSSNCKGLKKEDLAAETDMNKVWLCVSRNLPYDLCGDI